jgi:hypothetical protein
VAVLAERRLLWCQFWILWICRGSVVVVAVRDFVVVVAVAVKSLDSAAVAVAVAGAVNPSVVSHRELQEAPRPFQSHPKQHRDHNRSASATPSPTDSLSAPPGHPSRAVGDQTS